MALELFRSQGFERTPLRQIAGRVGITQATLYYHFRSKDELLCELVGPLLDRMEAILDGGTDERMVFLESYMDVLLAYPRVAGLLAYDLGVRSHR